MDNTTNSTFNNTSNSTFNGVPPTPKNFWTGLLLPVAYIFILFGSLWSFSKVYRQRQAQRALKLEPWFPPHTQRNIYLSLLHLDPSEAEGDSEKKLKQVPDSILKAALLKRAVEDIERIMQLRTAKPALQNLLGRGSVGDEVWQRFQRAEQEIELEVKDVVNEANAFQPGWGQVIFQSANEVVNNLLVKRRVDELKEKLEEEKIWWSNRRQGIQSEFLKELDMDEPSTETPKKQSSDDDAVLVDVSTPEGTQGSNKKKNKAKK
ncbi:hypothetical protein AMS68_001420 [Peltaster fructicola]|uniref:Translocation protein sec66 n=1 Tax=Peltaster fructicola TaxID=286661 RepID=A0A6H0XMF8_9PEZI|nr:hypothetical protein AMS68_001420 [Peltaster fructicola]